MQYFDGWSEDPEAKGAQAAASALAIAHGFTRFPLPDDPDGVELPDVATAIRNLAESNVFAPVKLATLGELAQRLDLSDPSDRGRLEPLARSLVQDDARADDLLDMIMSAQPQDGSSRTDPLGRTVDDDPSVGADFAFLVDDLRSSTLSPLPRCEGRHQIIDGYVALSAETTLVTDRPIDSFSSFVDPTQWPMCRTTGAFFRSMALENPRTPPPPVLPPPDVGWEATLTEVVDFSFGLSLRGSTMETNLKFTYFNNLPQAAGCTYDLVESIDRKILVDRGYLLAENLESRGLRRLTTLKQITFRARAQPPPPLACLVWSQSQAAAVHGCLGHDH